MSQPDDPGDNDLDDLSDDGEAGHEFGKWFLLVAFIVVMLAVLAMCAPVRAADVLTGAARSGWISGLHSKGGAWCCVDADSEDTYWEPNADGGYNIMVRGMMIPVPDEALIVEPNRIGKALLWMNYRNDGTIIGVRCFLPGAAY